MCPSFQDACVQHGLLANNLEWEILMTNAAFERCGAAIRNLFALLWVHHRPPDPITLWIQFIVPCSEDFTYSRTIDQQEHLFNRGDAYNATKKLYHDLLAFRQTVEQLQPLQTYMLTFSGMTSIYLQYLIQFIIAFRCREGIGASPNSGNKC
jgi:hypothetical protein